MSRLAKAQATRRRSDALARHERNAARAQTERAERAAVAAAASKRRDAEAAVAADARRLAEIRAAEALQATRDALSATIVGRCRCDKCVGGEAISAADERVEFACSAGCRIVARRSCGIAAARCGDACPTPDCTATVVKVATFRRRDRWRSHGELHRVYRECAPPPPPAPVASPPPPPPPPPEKKASPRAASSPRPPPKRTPPAPRPKKKVAPPKPRAAPPPPAPGVVVAVHGARAFFERDDGAEAFARLADVGFRVAVGDRVTFSVIEYKDFEGKRLMAVDVALPPEPEPEPESRWWDPSALRSAWNRRRRRAAATEGLNPTAAAFDPHPASGSIDESDLNAAATSWTPAPLDPAVGRLLDDLGLHRRPGLRSRVGPTLAKEEVDWESLCLLDAADLVDVGVGPDDAPVIVRAVNEAVSI